MSELSLARTDDDTVANCTRVARLHSNVEKKRGETKNCENWLRYRHFGTEDWQPFRTGRFFIILFIYQKFTHEINMKEQKKKQQQQQQTDKINTQKAILVDLVMYNAWKTSEERNRHCSSLQVILDDKRNRR